MLPTSKRWETILFLTFGVAINYCLRVSLGISAQDMEDDLGWSESDKGLILSSFFWGYAVAQLPASLIASEIGAKYTFAFSIFVPSVLHMLMPVAAKHSLTLALLTRAATGAACAPCFPSCFNFYPKWVPVAEKTVMISTVGCGMYIGEILGFSLSGYLVSTSSDIRLHGFQIGGWPLPFYIFGIAGVLWTPFFLATIYSTPDEHPTITKEELLFIQRKDYTYEPLLKNSSMASEEGAGVGDFAGRKQSRSSSLSQAIGSHTIPSPSEEFTEKKPKFVISEIPWVAMFTHPASLTLFLLNWVFGWIGFMLLTEMPSFLNDQLGYDLESSGLLSIAPYAANLLSVAMFAQMYDHLEDKKGWTIRGIRQNANQVAFLGSSACLIICGFLTNSGAAFTFMVFSLLFFGASQSGLMCCYLDISPNYSSVLNTVGNIIGSLAGLTGPLVVSALLSSMDDDTAWQIVFLLTGAQSVVALIVFYFFQSETIVDILNRPAIKSS